MKELKSEQGNGKGVNATENNNHNLDKSVRKRSSRCRKAKNISEGQRIQQNSKSTGSTIESHSICNHTEDLTIFCDASFFSRAYKTRNEKTNRSGKKRCFYQFFVLFVKLKFVTKLLHQLVLKLKYSNFNA